jgi:hypothetical protein
LKKVVMREKCLPVSATGQVFSSFIDSLTCSRCVMVGSLVLGNPEHKRKRSMEDRVAHKNIE